MRTDRICDAIELACRAHRRQLDLGGEPYIWHVLRVGMSLLPDEDAVIVGILHDVLEDSDLTYAEIRSAFGQPVGLNILHLTRQKTQPYADYIDLVRHRPLASRVKLADLADNLRPERLILAAGSCADVARLVRKYSRAMLIMTGKEDLLEEG